MKLFYQFKKLPDWLQKGIVFLTAIAAFALAVRENPYLYGTIIGLLLWGTLFIWSLLKYRDRLKYHSKKHHKYEKRGAIRRFIFNGDFFRPLFLLIFALGIVLIPSTSNFIQIGLGRKSPPEFKPATDNQMMIIVAEFEDKSAGKVSGFDLSGRIYRNLTDVIGENNLNFPVKQYLHTVISKDIAEQVLKDYDAIAIIWGSYDAAGGRLHITYYTLEENSNICTAQTEKSDFGYSQSNPNEIEFTLSEKLPTIASYITLLTIGKVEAVMMHNGEYSEKFLTDAINVAEESKEIFPVDALLYRAAVYDVKKRNDLARDDLEHIIENKPDYLQAYLDVGGIYLAQNEYLLAEKTYNNLLSLAPELPCGYIGRGNYYSQIGQNDLAIEDFSKSIKLNPNFEEGYLSRGSIYMFEGMYDQAISDFRKAIELDENDSVAYCYLGAGLTNKGKFDEAVSVVRKGISLGATEKEPACQSILEAALNEITVNLDPPK
jgi:Tfp pilus assembly protein PilF